MVNKAIMGIVRVDWGSIKKTCFIQKVSGYTWIVYRLQGIIVLKKTV